MIHTHLHTHAHTRRLHVMCRQLKTPNVAVLLLFRAGVLSFLLRTISLKTYAFTCYPLFFKIWNLNLCPIYVCFRLVWATTQTLSKSISDPCCFGMGSHIPTPTARSLCHFLLPREWPVSPLLQMVTRQIREEVLWCADRADSLLSWRGKSWAVMLWAFTGSGQPCLHGLSLSHNKGQSQPAVCCQHSGIWKNGDVPVTTKATSQHITQCKTHLLASLPSRTTGNDRDKHFCCNLKRSLIKKVCFN